MVSANVVSQMQSINNDFFNSMPKIIFYKVSNDSLKLNKVTIYYYSNLFIR